MSLNSCLITRYKIRSCKMALKSHVWVNCQLMLDLKELTLQLLSVFLKIGVAICPQKNPSVLLMGFAYSYQIKQKLLFSHFVSEF